MNHPDNDYSRDEGPLPDHDLDQDKEFVSALKALPLDQPSRQLDERITFAISNANTIDNIESDLRQSLSHSHSNDQRYRTISRLAMATAACLILATGSFRFYQATNSSPSDFGTEIASYLNANSSDATANMPLNHTNRPADSVNARFVGSIPNHNKPQTSAAQLQAQQALISMLKQVQKNYKSGDSIAWHHDNAGVQELHLKITMQYDRLVIHNASGKIIYQGPVGKLKQ